MARALTWITLGFSAAALLLCCAGFHLSSTNQPTFAVKIPTAVDETNYVRNLSKDVGFYQANGYRPSFPQDETVAALVAAATSGSLSHSDYSRPARLAEGKAYRPDQEK